MGLATHNESQLLLDLIRLNSEYAAAVDAAQWQAWIDFFTEDCIGDVAVWLHAEAGRRLGAGLMAHDLTDEIRHILAEQGKP